MAFTALALAQLAHVTAIRSERQSPFRQGIASNRPLLAAVAFTVALPMAAIYVPFMNALLSTDPLTAGELALTFALASAVFFAVGAEKWLVRRGLLYAEQNIGHARAPKAAAVD